MDLGEDRLAIWMEDVRTSDEPWTLDTFRFAARLLGGLAAIRSDSAVLGACSASRGFGLRRYYEGVVRRLLPCLEAHDLWQHPRVIAAGGTRLRADLRQLAACAPELLDVLDQLPQSLPHGDASPQNLLLPIEEPETLVAIDLALECPLAVGHDLGQLLVGLVHAGQMSATDLPRVHAVLPVAYLDGFFTGGGTVSLDQVTLGYVASLVLRSAFTSLPFRELTAELPDVPTYMRAQPMTTMVSTRDPGVSCYLRQS